MAAEKERAEQERVVAEKRAAAEKAAEEAACRADFECWGREQRFAAEAACKRQIERRARFDHEWTDSWTKPTFSFFAWRDEAAGVMTYFGDQLKLQNGFGAWAKMSYSCDFDMDAGIAVAVTISEGRL